MGTRHWYVLEKAHIVHSMDIVWLRMWFWTEIHALQPMNENDIQGTLIFNQEFASFAIMVKVYLERSSQFSFIRF